MRFSAAGNWFGRDYLENIAEAARYGFGAVEQLGWRGVDLRAELVKRCHVSHRLTAQSRPT